MIGQQRRTASRWGKPPSASQPHTGAAEHTPDTGADRSPPRRSKMSAMLSRCHSFGGVALIGFAVVLTSPTNATVGASAGTAVGTITDDGCRLSAVGASGGR